MLFFFAFCIDFLLYMSIIISVEREGVRDTPLGMKEMKEMKENFIYKRMLGDTLDRTFWKVMDARIYFLDELIYSDYMDYALDMAHDSSDLKNLLYKISDDYVHPYIARKISLHYKAVQELMIDIKFYLSKKYGINYDKELAKRKQKKKCKKRNEKKEGK